MKKTIAILASLVALLAASVAAQTTTYTFYFLPPDDEKWIAGNSYLYDGTTQEATLMRVDTAKCGWFKKEFTSLSAIPEKPLIYLGSQGRDKLGSNGTGANISDEAWLPLRDKFGTSSDLYFVADNLAFSTTAPGYQGEEANRCSYKMAAFIYDTDNSRNPSFNGAYKNPGDANNGIRRGIVVPYLDTLRVVGNDTLRRKPKFARTSVPYANWVDKESFDAAFTPKGLYKGQVSNIPRCYDMPFGRASNNNWEFDSDKMRTPTGDNPNLVGGFYPYILDSLYSRDEDGAETDYTSCPECRKEYQADCFNLLSNTQLGTLAPVAYKGVTYRGVEAFDRTYFPDGAGYYTYYGNTRGCTAPSPGYSNTTKNRANLSFCFESHAEFIYEKGQEFFFRGDDDIWVFINNRLVIDLGGIHMPAPGYVDLDTIKTPEVLVEGNRYPIDLFFCERMGTQSNVRISTNMYITQITQKSTFYNDPARLDNAMCASISAGNDCASKMGIGETKNYSRCGFALVEAGYDVEFYMVERGTTDTTYLSGTKNTTDCEGTDKVFACFKKDDGDGIKVDSAVYSCGGYGQCKGNAAATEKIGVPSGNWTVYSRLMDANGKQVGKPLIIDNIKTETDQPNSIASIPRIANVISLITVGNSILLENLPIGAKVELYNLQGKRIYSTTSHSLPATSRLEINVQTKGVYVVKIANQTMLAVVR